MEFNIQKDGDLNLQVGENTTNFNLQNEGTIELKLDENGEIIFDIIDNTINFSINEGIIELTAGEQKDLNLGLDGTLTSFEDLTNIKTDNLNDEQILQYNSETGNWENKDTDILEASWGGIAGTLSDQTDLWNELTTISTENFKDNKVYINEDTDTYIYQNSNGQIDLIKNGQIVQRW